MQQTIHFLDSETRSKLRSAQILTSISQIVSELVQNSLDANASQINVGVDVAEWECWVWDDGIGMSKKGMAILAQGPIKGRYGSSKAYEISSLSQVSTFGFRGEALASAADICCLEISSRTKSAHDTWSVIIKDGKSLHYGPAIRWRRETAGSVVSVRDAFYNLPVRRRTHPLPSKCLETIKKDLQSFALVFPHVSFSLEDTSKDHQTNQSRGKVISIPRTSSPLEAFRSVFGRALAENVHMIRNQADGALLEGFIGLEGASSKAYQFIYVNRRLLEPCNLHYVVDSLFSRSTFGKNAFEDDGPTTARQTARRSPRKNEKRPAYVLQLTIARDTVDSLLDPSKRSVYLSEAGLIQDMIALSVKDFLVRNNFLSPAKHMEPEDEEPGQESEEITGDINVQSTAPRFPQSKSGPKPKRKHFQQEIFASLQDEDDGVTEWENPQTGEIFLINNRTGTSGANGEAIRSSGIKSRRGQKLCLNTEPPTTSNEQPEWIKEIITDWKNPVFKTGERDIAVHKTKQLVGDSVGGKLSLRQTALKPGESSTTVFTASDLASAEVLGQVDRKFIACIVKNHSEGDILLLVDQHAADERVRVERFLQEYCDRALASEDIDKDDGIPMDGAETTLLKPSKLVLLSKQEAALLYTVDIRGYLRRWGIELDDDSDKSNTCDGEHIQVGISAVPKLIEGKLLQGNELQDALKSVLGDIEMDGIPAWHSGEESMKERAPTWLRAWRACPISLLNLINSKACRGAIMFNDVLTQEQCCRLVLQLSQSVFPFQCAHGRPSVAPLVSLNSLDERVARSSSNSPASSRAIDWLSFRPL